MGGHEVNELGRDPEELIHVRQVDADTLGVSPTFDPATELEALTVAALARIGATAIDGHPLEERLREIATAQDDGELPIKRRQLVSVPGGAPDNEGVLQLWVQDGAEVIIVASVEVLTLARLMAEIELERG
jgi:hypothetical protein